MKFYLSLAEQVVAAYLFSFVGLLLSDGTDLTHVSVLASSAVAAIPAGLMVLKGALAKVVGDPNSANLLS